MTTREQQIEQAERIARLNPEWTWNGQALGGGMSTIQCRCPWCGYRFSALTPADLSLFKTCPNPNRLPGDTPAQVAAGGRLCRGDLTRVVFALDASGSWAKA